MAHLTCWVWTLCVAGYAASVSAEDIVGYRFLSWPDPQEIDISEASFSTRSRLDCEGKTVLVFSAAPRLQKIPILSFLQLRSRDEDLLHQPGSDN